MIKLFNISKTYPGKIHALSNINLHVAKGEFIFIAGPSGAGKSTLLKLFFAEEFAEEGQIIVNGINLLKVKRKMIPYHRRSIGIIFQDFKLLNSKTVFENVAFSLIVTGVKKKSEINKRTYEAIKLVGLSDKRDAYPLKLSGGEQQRIAIARAVVNEPPLIIADEPTGNLDPELSVDILDIFRRLNEKGSTIVFATHNRALIKSTNFRRVIISKGRLLSEEDFT
ncbi:MAG: cell division ATP-binding protein FtsE [Nitrospinae bacterium]|nr:cell division ATP-binding protein FtsE [Nitrospinota bacterium]